MKTYGGSAVTASPFFTSALDEVTFECQMTEVNRAAICWTRLQTQHVLPTSPSWKSDMQVATPQPEDLSNGGRLVQLAFPPMIRPTFFFFALVVGLILTKINYLERMKL